MDPPSIDVISLAIGVASAEALTGETAFEFTSRSRTPAIGQTIIWRNQNGLYAAMQIVAIKDDSRYNGSDELAARYVILADGARTSAPEPAMQR